jgi:hypothetical protein
MNSSVDDYNWKFPSRTDTMYLSKFGKKSLTQTINVLNLRLNAIH